MGRARERTKVSTSLASATRTTGLPAEPAAIARSFALLGVGKVMRSLSREPGALACNCCGHRCRRRPTAWSENRPCAIASRFLISCEVVNNDQRQAVLALWYPARERY